MSNNFRRETSPERLRKLATRLSGHGIDLPGEIAEHLALLDRIDEAKPQHVAAGDVIAAYLADKPAKEIERLSLLQVTSAARAEAWREARIGAALAGLRAVPGHGNDITRELASLAAPLIEVVTRTAEIETHDVAALMRGGRTEEAHLVAAFETTCGELWDLYDLRRRVTEGADWGNSPQLNRAVGFVGASCAMWRDPRKIGKAPAGAIHDQWRDGIRAGGELWFPLPHESEKASREVTAEIAKAEFEAQVAASGGFNTGMGGVRVR